VESLHLDETAMDQYALGLMPEDETAGFEEHLLVCDSCQERLAQNDAFVRAIQGAGARFVLAKSTERREWRAPLRLVGALAAGLLMVSGATVWRLSQAPGQPVPVSLNADRGAAVGAQAPAGRELALHFEMLGLPSLPSYELQIVDRWGAQVLRENAAPGFASVPALQPGQYYIRLYAPGGALLREYGFDVLSRHR